MNTYTLESLRTSCPAVFAEAPAMGVSDRYSFIPTYKVLEPMMEEGWRITHFSSQPKGRYGSPDPTGFHMLRMIPPGEVVTIGDGHLEAILLNSHNRTRRLSARAGVWRLVCKNGLMLPAGMAIAETRLHLDTHINVQDVIAGFNAVAKSYPQIAGSVEQLKKRTLSPAEQTEFAAACLASRYGKAPPTVGTEAVLKARRTADEGDSLWLTLNRVQENIMWGTTDGRHSSKPISSLIEQTRVNTKLWELATELLQRN